MAPFLSSLPFALLFTVIYLFLVGLGLRCCVQAFSSSDAQASPCDDFSCCRARLWGSGSVVVVHCFSYPMACGIFRDQGMNPCPLHWQADS